MSSQDTTFKDQIKNIKDLPSGKFHLDFGQPSKIFLQVRSKSTNKAESRPVKIPDLFVPSLENKLL